jgi:predicted acylesterase/phospholipase RssA
MFPPQPSSQSEPPPWLGVNLWKTYPGGPGLGESYNIGLALSGGGHRAALFGLGVLMALRDVGKIDVPVDRTVGVGRMTQIASVSGGSITNAVLAREYFRHTAQLSKPEERDALWERATRHLFQMIVEVGILTKWVLRIVVAVLILPPLVVGAVMLINGSRPAAPWLLIGATAWLSLALLRGKLVERLIRARCFPSPERFGPHLEDLSTSTVEHVFCATDLVMGRPVYFSTRKKGLVFRRTADPPPGAPPRTRKPQAKLDELDLSRLGCTYCAGTIDLAAVVRASAGFPGIPPRRTVWTDLGAKDSQFITVTPSTGFLSDGGIWNNLATQPFEDGFLWGQNPAWVVVVADASAPLRTLAAPGRLQVPGLAEFSALKRQVDIQNTNTVGPRRGAFLDTFRRELISPRDAAFQSERLYLVISAQEGPTSIVQRFEATIAGDLHDGVDAHVDDSERQLRRAARESILARIKQLKAWSSFDSLCRISQVRGAAASPAEKSASSLGLSGGPRDPVAEYPTTLGRVDRQVATALVGRGYANTIITLFLSGLLGEAPRLTAPASWLAGSENWGMRQGDI